MDSGKPTVCHVKPTALGIFIASFQIGLFSLGGGMSAWLHREFVVKRAWMDEQSFQLDLAVARVLPGTNISNFLVIGGYRMAGLAGATAGLIGILLAPFFIVLGLALAYDQLAGPFLGYVLEGAAAAALGFLVRMVAQSVRHIGTNWTNLVMIVAVALALGIFGASLVPFIAIALPCSIGLALLRRTFGA